jgi:hypothetical protein
MATGELLIEYYTWRSRLVPAQPRRVHRSTALNRLLRGASARRRAEVESVLAEIAQGADLTPRLSKLITQGFKPGSGSRRRDQDLMLNDWGVHHLHLGDRKGTGQFAERTGDVLYVAFTDADAYVVGVFTHADWANVAVLNIMADEWPDEGVIFGSRGDISLDPSFTPGDRKALRQGGVTVLHGRRGRVFFPRSGVSTALTAISAAGTSNAVIHGIRSVLEDLAREPDLLWKQVPVARRPPTPADCDWHLYLTARGFGLQDGTSGHRLE